MFFVKPKLYQVGNDKIAVITSPYVLAEKEFEYLRNKVLEKLPDYKILVLECMDGHFGNASIKYLQTIHDKIHKFLGI